MEITEHDDEATFEYDPNDPGHLWNRSHVALRTTPGLSQHLAGRRGTRARRWVVERTHSWMNRFRAILVRWDKKTVNYEGSLHLASAYIAFCRRRVNTGSSALLVIG